MTTAAQRLSRISEELDAKNAELAEAQRIAKLGFWRWEPLTGKFSWSDELFRLLDRDPATFEVTVESTFACIHAEDRDATMARLVATVNSKQPQSHQYRALLSDGHILHLWSSTRPVFDGTGEVIEVRGICQDISSRVHAELALRESEDHYRHAVELNPQIPWTADADGNVVEMAPRWCELIGMSEQEALGGGWSDALHPEDLEPTLVAWRAALISREPLDIEYRLRLQDGSYNWMRVRAAPRLDPNGRVLRWYGTAEDIQAQKAAEFALRESEARLTDVLESTSDCVVVVDRDWLVTYRNQRALAAAAVPGNLQIGERLWNALPVPPDGGFRQRLETALELGEASEFETFVPGPNIWFEVYVSPSREGLSIFFRDVTEARKARDEINYLAHHDALTGLPNRALFLKRLEEVLSAAAQTKGSVGLVYLDLDDFKEVNDTIGHHAGDVVLVEASHRLLQSVPDETMVARLGGDEFAILLATTAASKQAEKIASDVQTALSRPMMYEGDEVSCKASLGIALYPESDARASELTKNADLALYAAKRAGGNQHAFFNPEVRKGVQQKVSALACAREALLRDAIVPFYQPKVSLETGKLHGFEALLRWVHPRHGIQPPGLIKEAFEDPVLSVEIGRRMLQRVINDMKAWQQDGLAFGNIAVNIAAQQFSRTDIAGEILASLNEAELTAALLEIEITETVFLGDGSDAVGQALCRLHDQGVSIALDDFGTGYASLTHLNKFPVSWLKVDQSFVKNMECSPNDAAIIRAVVALAHGLGIKVVAEGVETQQQWNRLRDKGCDLAQGYLVSKPMSGAYVPYFIRKGSLPSYITRKQALG